jgi:hypothetical protein
MIERAGDPSMVLGEGPLTTMVAETASIVGGGQPNYTNRHKLI